MPRQVRIEYSGALYHVMARGDRREAIFETDRDRESFLKTLGEACKRTGFVVHAYVLLDNHYHLLLETPEANLSTGMGWLQNTFTRRINVSQGKWGHLFGGRYKALVVEAGNGFWAIMDYIHLNPVRAGLILHGQGLCGYPWSSLRAYCGPKKKRAEWLETAMGYGVAGVQDTAGGRREFLKMLESRVDWRRSGQAGVKFSAGGNEGNNLDVGALIARGWMIGSESFREKLLGLVGKKLNGEKLKVSDGYHGREVREHGELRAQKLLESGLEHYGLKGQDLKNLAKGDMRKAVVAAVIHRETTVKLDWISERLAMGARAGCCRLIRRAKEEWGPEFLNAKRAIIL